jgi:dihydroxyacetone kinase-like predicted kinase
MGTLSRIKIENMKEQHTQLQEDVKFVVASTKKYGFVVTCSGQGLVNIFKDLGADKIVEGGQTMNPSTEDILEAIDKTPSDIVFVLPNNKNIIMAAQQAAKLSKKQVTVIETKTIPQGISAMLGFDADMELEKI